MHLKTSVTMLAAVVAFFLVGNVANAQQLLNLGPDLLPQDEAFAITARADNTELQFEVDIADGYYLYRDRSLLRPLAGTTQLATLQTPPGTTYTDEFFGEVEIYRDLVQFTVLRPQGQTDLLVELVIQGCADVGVCYPPYISSYTFTPDGDSGVLMANNLPDFTNEQSEPVANTNALYTYLADSSLWLVIALFFNAGILLSFTPCVLPLIPIAIGVVTDAGNRSRMHSFSLGLIYVASMAFCYTLIGIATAQAGGALAGTLQQPWILYPLAAVFAFLGIAMLFEINMQLLPSSLSRRLQNIRHKQGTVPGAIISGIVAAVVVSPCVAAPLAGALLFIATTGDTLIGGVALMSLGLGMGVFPLLCATGAKGLVPRAGPASVMLRQLFGLMLVGLGIWILPPQVPEFLKMIGLGALAAVVFVLALLLVGKVRTVKAKGAVGALSGIFFLLATVLIVGGLTGGTNVVAPLAHLSDSKSLRFSPVVSIKEYSDLRVEADGPILEYYYADWCVSCRKLEGYTFADGDVITKLADYQLIKVDLTANNPELIQLMALSEIVGPPALIMRNRQGDELAKLVGYVDQETLLEVLTQLDL